MECARKIIYFSVYENGAKTRSAGYAAIFLRGEVCDVQMYYRGAVYDEESRLQPVYVFRDGTVTLGNEFDVEEGMGVTEFRTGRRDFVQSGHSMEELETIYLDGIKTGICGGRTDGRELEEAAYSLANCVDEVAEKGEEVSGAVIPEEEKISTEMKCWPLPVCLERFPELKLPFDGIRRICCRMTLEDMEHLPEEWKNLKDNHFLLHGYYEYHHLILARLACRYGERYAIGVPGEFCYRNQYMAENFGFFDFAPLEPGKRRGGCFGYWYYYLETK